MIYLNNFLIVFKCFFNVGVVNDSEDFRYNREEGNVGYWYI